MRSAEPPTSSGSAGASASSALWLACRVARVGRFSARSALSAAIGSCQFSGKRPAVTRSNSARIGCRARRFNQARRAPAARVPALRHRSANPSGTVKGGSVQPKLRLASRDSRSPSGVPCTAALPALVGAPSPMMVRQAISVGFFDRTAKEMAAATWAASCPSTRLVAQPCAAKRRRASSEQASPVSPSIETALSS